MSRYAPPVVRIALVASFALTTAGTPMRAQTVYATPSPILRVEWGLRPDSVRQRLSDVGWRFVTIDEDSDYVFHGSVDGIEAVAFATFTAERLTALQVNLSPHPGASHTYSIVLDTLASVNGPALFSSATTREYRPANFLTEAAAWPGLLAGLRRDGWITLIFTCPERSPALPSPNGLRVHAVIAG